MFFWIALLLGTHPMATSPWWVECRVDGTVERSWLAPAQETGPSGPFAVWFLAPGAAPRRWVPTEAVSRAAEDTAGLLRVELAGKQRPLFSHLLVIAAPASMWRDVPEDLLPRWRPGRAGSVVLTRRLGEPWRLRVVGQGQASGWLEVAPEVSRVLVPISSAADVSLELVSPEGRPVLWSQLAVSPRLTAAVPIPMARFRATPETLVLPSLQPDLELSFSASAPGFLPRTYMGPVADVPRRWVLERGVSVVGRFLDSTEKPIADVRVVVEGWFSGSPFPLRRESGTDAEGRFQLENLPAGSVALGAGKAGFVRYLTPVEIPVGGLDLGTLTLARGVELILRVLDESGDPIANARVELRGSEPRFTDRSGRVTLSGLPHERPESVAIEAPGFVSRRQALRPPLPDVLEVRLPGALLVRGSYLDGENAPLPASRLTILDGTRTDRRNLEPNGSFELTLEPGRAFNIELSSASSIPTKVAIETGFAGEVRDLGVVRAVRGRRISGRLIHAEDGSPAVGAQISAPRSGSVEAVLDRLRGDLLTTTSDAEGSFRLQGVGQLGSALRLEALGRARVELALPAGVEALDLGDIELLPGGEVRLTTEGPFGAEATARLDLGNRWSETDMLEAPLIERRAIFRHVPAGRATVSVVRGRELLCEVSVDVPVGGAIDADCDSSGIHVTGLVTVGGQSTGVGSLHWQPAASEIPGLILRNRTPLGAEKTEAFGVGRPQVEAIVQADGSYTADGLRPGRWEVVFSSDQGWATGVVSTVLPRADEFQLDLTFPGRSLAGRVVDEDGEPVTRARVRELQSGLVVLTDEDGQFRMLGLAAGQAVLRADAEGRSSSAVTLQISTEPPELVTLVLGNNQDEQLTLRVLDPGGVPISGALVFLELEGRGLRIMTTATDGATSAPIDAPHPVRVRLAALTGDRWVLGPWFDWSPASASPRTLTAGPAGSLEIRAEERAGVAEVVSGSGWNLTALARRAGIPMEVASDRPLLLGELPVGTYRVMLGETSSTAAVTEGGVAVVVVRP